jgi:hypothetical protein
MPSRYFPVRTPEASGEAEADLVVERRVLPLDAVAPEQVVLRLLHQRRMQVVVGGEAVGGEDALGGPLRGAPVVGVAAVDDVVHRPDRLLDGRVGVGAVAEDQVDDVVLQPLHGALDGFEQVLAVQRVARVDGVVEAPVELAGDDVRLARPAQVLNRLAHDPLRLAAGVDLGVVEEVDPGVAGDPQALGGEVAVELGTEGDPRSEGEEADPQPRASQVAILHASHDGSG